jgi:hypothetical protein
MSKKKTEEQKVDELGPDPFEEDPGYNTAGDLSGENEEGLGDVNFDVDDEYKPDPLIPKGTYHGVCTKVKYEAAKYCIVWDFCLHDNGGAMSDGETPIDNAHVYYRNWLPKPGDENEMTKSGRSNKRQSKINMLMDFQKALEVDMSTPAKIATALAEQHWIGVEADLDVDVDEYLGRFRNVVNGARASKMF